MLLNVRRKFVRVVRTFRTGALSAADAFRVSRECRDGVMRAVTDGAEAYLANSERLSEIFEIVLAVLCLVSGESRALNVGLVSGAAGGILAQLFDSQFTRGSNVERHRQ